MEPMPNVLLVEDDPISCDVLGAALERCAVMVETAGCVRDALYAAGPGRHALWLIDAHLPDGTGTALLAALRRVDPDAIAVAHTASQDPDLHLALRAAGFVEVLVKPLSAAHIAAALSRWLPSAAPASALDSPCAPVHDVSGPPVSVWNDAVALRAMAGNEANVHALRLLFLAELPAALDRVTAAVRSGDAAALHAQLHRLHASCGFVGAACLEPAIHRLGMQPDEAALERFRAAAQALLATVPDAQSA